MYPGSSGGYAISFWGGPVGGYTNTPYPGQGVFTVGPGTNRILMGPFPLLSLNPATEYVVLAHEGEGYDTVESQPAYFETLPAGSLPAIQEGSASSVTANSVQFSTIIVPNGQPTTVWFSFTIGTTVFSSPATNVPANDSQESIGPWIATNLPPATTIYWQVVASNLWGATSQTQSVETLPLPPSILNLIIKNVTSSSVSISVLLNPNGADACVSVLATNNLTGSVTNTPFTDIGNGNSPTYFATQLTGLSSSNAYTACLVTTNSGGSNFATFQFTTIPILPPLAPTDLRVVQSTSPMVRLAF
jgi:hypothetical protein